MKLSLMRHGTAEDHADSRVDADRALAPDGRRRVVAVAKLLGEERESPAAIVTSPLVRAVQTAEIVAVVTGVDSVEVSRDLSPGGNAVRLVQRLAAAQRSRVLLVGHEPDLSSLAAAMLGDFNLDFEKAMVVGLKLAPTSDGSGAPRLRFVVEPRSPRLTRSSA